MAKKPTKKQLTLDFLKLNGSITSRQANDEFNGSRLAAYIGELKKDFVKKGSPMKIVTIMKHDIDSITGRPCKYAVYHLEYLNGQQPTVPVKTVDEELKSWFEGEDSGGRDR
jgi:hypothetical protein